MYCTDETRYDNLSFYWLGWNWGYAIMLIMDTNREFKVRLAKCKKLTNFPKTEMYKWENVDEKKIANLSQVNHINFKTFEELKACF